MNGSRVPGTRAGSWAVGAGLGLLAACGGNQGDPGRRFVPGTGATPGEATGVPLDTGVRDDLEWQPCPRRSGGSGVGAECITVSAPLRRDVQESAYIDFFVKRWKPDGERRGQLWLLQGGPGLSGVELENYAEILSKELPDLEIYIPDHRGTGRSQWFECVESMTFDEPDLSSAFRSCAEEIDATWGEDVAAFRTTEAAWDVIDMIRLTRSVSEPVFVHGGSYGGYWLHRVLQLAPEAVDGAIFESSADPMGQRSMLDLLLDRHEAGDAVLSACANDEFCSSRLGSDPEASAQAILDGIDDCDALVDVDIDRAWFQALLTQTLLFSPAATLVPALLARAGACTAEDAAFLAGYAQALDETTLGEPAEMPEEMPDAVPEVEADPIPDSVALLFQINLSELQPNAVARETLQSRARSALFPETELTLELNDVLSYWPVYETAPPEGQFAETDAPILILHGTFDPRTGVSIGRELGARYAAPNQYYFEVPYAGHGVVYSSHVTHDDVTCGEEILVQFLTDPETRPDGGCIDDTPAPDFERSPLLTDTDGGAFSPWPASD